MRRPDTYRGGIDTGKNNRRSPTERLTAALSATLLLAACAGPSESGEADTFASDQTAEATNHEQSVIDSPADMSLKQYIEKNTEFGGADNASTRYLSAEKMIDEGGKSLLLAHEAVEKYQFGEAQDIAHAIGLESFTLPAGEKELISADDDRSAMIAFLDSDDFKDNIYVAFNFIAQNTGDDPARNAVVADVLAQTICVDDDSSAALDMMDLVEEQMVATNASAGNGYYIHELEGEVVDISDDSDAQWDKSIAYETITFREANSVGVDNPAAKIFVGWSQRTTTIFTDSEAYDAEIGGDWAFRVEQGGSDPDDIRLQEAFYDYAKTGEAAWATGATD